jgi:hypothetical protein
MSLSSFPPWLQVGAIVESGSARYTVTRVLDAKVAILRSHANDAEARFGIDLIARNFKPCDGAKPWMKVGVRLALKGSPRDQVEIADVTGNEIQVREIDPDLKIPLPNPTIRTLTAADVEQVFDPLQFQVPRWCGPGSRILLKTDNNTLYEVKDVDLFGGSFTAFQPSMPTRLQRFNVHGFENHWQPYSTLRSDLTEEVKPRRILAPAVIPNAAIPTAPDWLRPGSLLRPCARHLRRSFWVMSIHPDRGVCRIQRVASFDPLQMEPNWEDLAFEVAEKDWEPLNEDGSPLHERKCPNCGTYGGRHKEAEAAQPYKIRIYHCPGGHRWSFIDGGNDDGKPAPPTRFERDFDL